MQGALSIETMVILDVILGYSKNFDKKLTDPVWETVSLKIKKYKPFLNIDVTKYKNILKSKSYEQVFESEVVRDTVMELENMQRQLAADMIGIGNYSEQEKRDHLKLLKAFLEKQKLFFFRVLSLR